MSANNTFLAVFLGSKTSPKWAARNALTETERQKRQQERIAAWKSVGREDTAMKLIRILSYVLAAAGPHGRADLGHTNTFSAANSAFGSYCA